MLTQGSPKFPKGEREARRVEEGRGEDAEDQSVEECG